MASDAASDRDIPPKTPSHPLARFSSVFPSLNMAVKRREQTLQDYKRLQSKVEKYEEKERTGPVLAKLHQVPRCSGPASQAGSVAKPQGSGRAFLLAFATHAKLPRSTALWKDVLLSMSDPHAGRLIAEMQIAALSEGKEPVFQQKMGWKLRELGMLGGAVSPRPPRLSKQLGGRRGRSERFEAWCLPPVTEIRLGKLQ